MKKEKLAYCFCSVCKEEQPVTATMTKLDFCYMPVVYLDEQVTLGWEESNISGDFIYTCENCDTVLAKDLNELRAKINESETQLQHLHSDSVEQQV